VCDWWLGVSEVCDWWLGVSEVCDCVGQVCLKCVTGG